MKKKRVILVSGMSGAGKTSATSVLEDMGYHCIDQFPVQLLSLLVDLIENSTDPRYSYLALATSAKDFPEFLKAFEGEDMDVRVLFLDASNEELLHRYKSTRRTHPLLISNACNTLEEAISVERQMFQNYKDTAFLLVDTTFLKASELKQKIEKYFSLSSAPVFSISFISFGYKWSFGRTPAMIRRSIIMSWINRKLRNLSNVCWNSLIMRLRNMLRKARIISLWRLAVPAASIALFRSRISCMTTIKFNITVIKNTAISGD